MSVAKQVDLSLHHRTTGEGKSHLPSYPPLTPQQQRVLKGVCEGLRNKDIGAQLGVSESAVKATLQELFRKLSVRRRVQLVRIVLGELPLPEAATQSNHGPSASGSAHGQNRAAASHVS